MRVHRDFVLRQRVMHHRPAVHRLLNIATLVELPRLRKALRWLARRVELAVDRLLRRDVLCCHMVREAAGGSAQHLGDDHAAALFFGARGVIQLCVIAAEQLLDCRA